MEGAWIPHCGNREGTREVETFFCDGAGLLSMAPPLFLAPDIIGEPSSELLRSLSARIGLLAIFLTVAISKN